MTLGYAMNEWMGERAMVMVLRRLGPNEVVECRACKLAFPHSFLLADEWCVGR